MTTDVRVLYIDAGPVEEAARILVEQSTLSDYLVIRADDDMFVVEPRDGALPLGLAGSGTKALWELLKAIAYRRFEVSMHEVAARCDDQNRACVVEAITALCARSAS